MIYNVSVSFCFSFVCAFSQTSSSFLAMDIIALGMKRKTEIEIWRSHFICYGKRLYVFQLPTKHIVRWQNKALH